MNRAYLDWNATTPLRPAARAAMVAAMDVVGNPSSVHGEGRAAKALIERARGQVAAACGAEASDIVFVSSATEGCAMALSGRGLTCAPVEHEAVLAWCDRALAVDANGAITVADPGASAVQLANSETGVVQALPEGVAFCDATQGFGKIPFAFEWSGADVAVISAHKFGGPKGVAAVLLRRGLDLPVLIKGGGQEMGRRSGTENIIGIAGLGAAAQAASEDLANGIWDGVAELRNILETALEASEKVTILVGKDSLRLPNTSCILAPGWKGETQVMQMDLGGFAISAGSACSSGKVRASAVLRAMGYDEDQAASAIRVSLGPQTTRDEIERFADRWLAQERKYRAKAV
ncbi:cysteine desulfurase family protein [Oceaniglobus ichthyenteri]|uniref:cysteine desulfurase family protein n=1 Tax=Oceaniglobus ichthyenteri TaxID=2136177 RepID=UPI000D36A061|nr:aminotransferase class V-fold PLP-dependent enzyme [Oceaniglobus ichthyenteri]